MYNPIIKTMTNSELNICRILYKDGTIKETTIEEADKIVPISKKVYYDPYEIRIVEIFKDGSEKTYVSTDFIEV